MRLSEDVRVQVHVKNAQRLNTPATLTLAEWHQTLSDFNGLCAYCSFRAFDLLEHFIPVEIAGTTVNNCLPACLQCNIKKSNRAIDALCRLFGSDVIIHLQQYLSNRKNGSVNPKLAIFTPRSKSDSTDKRLTMEQLRAWLKISERTAFRLVKIGELKGFKAGREWRFEESDIQDFIKRQREKAAQQVIAEQSKEEAIA